MSPRSEKYHLLSHDESADLDSNEDHSPSNQVDKYDLAFLGKPRRALPWKWLLLASIILNLVLVTSCLIYVVRMYYRPEAQKAATGTTPYAKLARDPEAKWPYSTGYGADVTNHTLLDERWEAINWDDGIVAIDKQWAHDMNLAETQPFPWDESKGIYLITAFHSLHCVQTLHRLIYELHHDLPRTRSTHHALHCLDHLRTDAMCEADDFLLPTGPPRYMNPGPRGQTRVCRNWDQLAAWARQRNACYARISDDEERFALEHSQIERFLDCPPDSPYYDRVVRFKQEKGFP